MSSKHTPGPWRVSDCQIGNDLLIEHGDEGEFSPLIGSVYADCGRLPQDANARLIAAAPDLLAALKQAVEWLERKGEDRSAGGIVYGYVKDARAAIAKAEGGGA